MEKDSLEEAEVWAKLQWTLEENERLNHEKEEASRTLVFCTREHTCICVQHWTALCWNTMFNTEGFLFSSY